MNADGTGVMNVANDAAAETAFTWSPAGDRLAFVSDRDGSRQIYVVRADGTGLIRLTRGPGVNSAPQWGR